MQNQSKRVVVLGTGGTIAGTAASSSDHTGYRAGQLAVQALVEGVPALRDMPLEAEQVAQLDSKDMDYATWQTLARRVGHHLAREEVCGVVITHGTDTLEETAYFLQRVLAPTKPVVLTAAMRPATAIHPDGPQNLLDAVGVARHPQARGVVAVVAGTIHGAIEVRKVHTYRLDAFGSGDAGPIGCVEEGRVRQWRPWPQGEPLGLGVLEPDPAGWPRVEIVTSHTHADGALVRALCNLGVAGLVVAATGNGTVHRELETALLEAQAAGVRVLRSTRCLEGPIVGREGDALPVTPLIPSKARVELLLRLMAGR